MEKVMERIFKMMEGIESDPNYAIKSYMLGQIAGSISKGKSVWTIQGYADGSGEILEEILDELEVSYKTLTCQDNIYTISFN